MLAFICAMQSEAESLLSLIKINKKIKVSQKTVYEGSFPSSRGAAIAAGWLYGLTGRQLPCVLIISGIGKVNAALCTQILIDKYKPETIINAGVCGAVNKNLKIGGVYNVGKAVQYDFDLSKLNNCAVGKLEEFKNKFISVKNSAGMQGPRDLKILATGDRFSDDTADIILLRKILKADLRDMEGAAIAQVCALNKMDLIIIKAVTNHIGEGAIDGYKANLALALNSLAEALRAFITFSLYDTLL